MKERRAWQQWEARVQQFKQRRQGPAPVFPTETEVLEHVLAGVKQDELCIQVQYLQSHEDVVRIRAVKRRNRKLDLRLIACMVTRHITMPYSHLSRALMATFLLKKVI